MGRIYKPTQPVRKDGKVVGRRATKNWYIEWTDPSGRTRRKAIGQDRSIARQALALKETERAYARAGLPAPSSARVALREVIQNYLVARRPHVSDRHYRDMESTLSNFLLKVGATTADELTQNRASAHLDRLAEAGASGRTLNRHLGNLQACLNWAHTTGLLPQPHPVSSLQKRPERRVRMRRALTRAEADLLLQSVSGDERLAYLLALYAGIRQGEMAQMIWADVDLDRELLTIRPEIEKARRGATLPAHAAIVEALGAKYRNRRPAQHEPIVRIARRPAERLAASLERVGIPYRDGAGQVADFHALRHTCLTWLNRAGCDPRTLQALARHASPSTTLGIYVHRDRERERAAIRALPAPGPKRATG